MADRVKLVERIARRGLRLLEKRNERREKANAALAKQVAIETALTAQRLAKRQAEFAAVEAWQARRRSGETKPRLSTTREQRKSKREARDTKREQRKIRREARVQERAAKMAAKEAIQAAKRELAAIRRRALRLPPLPYSKAPPLPY